MQKTHCSLRGLRAPVPRHAGSSRSLSLRSGNASLLPILSFSASETLWVSSLHRVPCRFAPVTLRRCPSCRFPHRKPFGFPPYPPLDPGWRTKSAIIYRQCAPKAWENERNGRHVRRAGACSRRICGKTKDRENTISSVYAHEDKQKSGEECKHSRRILSVFTRFRFAHPGRGALRRCVHRQSFVCRHIPICGWCIPPIAGTAQALLLILALL